MTHLYLVRHAETDQNANPIYIGGRSNHLENSDKGKLQSEYLKQHMQTQKDLIDVIYASPAKRTLLLADYVKQGGDYRGEIIVDDRLQEIDQGERTGKNRAEIYADEVKQIIQSDPRHFASPGGESIYAVASRMNEVIDEIVQKYPEGHARVVSHGVAIAAAIMLRFGMNGARIKQFPYYNTGITHIEYIERGLENRRLVSYNDVSHLPKELRTLQ